MNSHEPSQGERGEHKSEASACNFASPHGKESDEIVDGRREIAAALRVVQTMRPGTFLLLLASLLAAARGLVVGPAPVRPRALSPRSISPAACAAEEVTASDLAISFSDAAMTQLQSLKAKQGGDELVVRMGVRAGGCSGMSYVMDVAGPEAVNEEDTVVEYEGGIRCAIDPKSLMFLYGLRLDYSDALIGGGFSFQNPNAESTCGCGTSFGV